MYVTFNIGLNDNPFTYDQIVSQLAELKKYRLAAYTEDLGEYEENPEPTLVCVINFTENIDLKVLITFTKKLCEKYSQECIPFSCDIADLLIWNDFYIGGKFKFDEKYFKRIKGF